MTKRLCAAAVVLAGGGPAAGSGRRAAEGGRQPDLSVVPAPPRRATIICTHGGLRPPEPMAGPEALDRRGRPSSSTCRRPAVGKELP
jgi:hypothetical protein